MRHGSEYVGQYYITEGIKDGEQSSACLFCNKEKLTGHLTGCPVVAGSIEKIIDKVDVRKLQEYKEPHLGGPIIGKAEVLDKETGQPIQVDIRVEERGFESLQYSVYGPDGRVLGYTRLKDMDTEKISREADFEVDGKMISNPLRLYGNEQESFSRAVYVDQMESYRKDRYSGIGQVAHQVAVERSFQIGGEGRVQLFVSGLGSAMSMKPEPGTSAPFHESFGFRAYDVHYADGTLHHTGASIHERIDESRAYDAASNERLANYFDKKGDEDSAKKHRMPREKVRVGISFNPKYDLPFMYLDKQAIERERVRMQAGPLIQCNEQTVQALLVKHEFFQTLAYERYKAESVWKGKTDGVLTPSDMVRTAEHYAAAGETEAARMFYYNAALDIKDEAAEHNHFYSFIEAGNLFNKAEQGLLAQGCYEAAISLVQNIKGAEQYLPELYAKAGKEFEARQLYREY